MTAAPTPCHDHSQDIGFSAIHIDLALLEIGKWVLTEKPDPETVARRLLAMRIELASVRAMRIADRLIEEATAHHERERETKAPAPRAGTGWPRDVPYDVEADGGVGG